MKRIIGFFLVLFTVMSFFFPAAAATQNGYASIELDTNGTGIYKDAKVLNVQITLDDVLQKSDVPAFVFGGRTMVPLRMIAETLNAEVQWFSESKEILITKSDKSIRLKVGSACALVNEVNVQLPDAVPVVLAKYNGAERTMVPLRFISEHFGVSVGWDQNTQTASIITDEYAAITIVLDPGHGGSHPGAYYEGVAEKDINLEVAKKVAELLKAQGYRVIMTHSEDVYMGLVPRAALANKVKADLFVSIHSNATNESNNYSGIYTYYYSKSKGDKRLAQCIQTEICQHTNAIDRGILWGDYVVLKRTKMSAVLVELGFMTNHTELQNMTNSSYQYKLANGIVAGINNYFQ